MELIERYLQAVGFWLPRPQRADLLAELSEDIQSELDSREAELGRKVNDEECAALLKRRGDPLLVARRYLPERHLIGPVLYPIYGLVLRVYAFVWVVPWLLVWLGAIIFFPAYRSGHPFQKLEGLWLGSIYLLFFTTLGFAIVERFKIGLWFGDDWDPRRLRPKPDPQRIPRSSSLFEFVGGFAFLLWWATVCGLQTQFAVAGARITLVQEWRYFIAGFLAISVVAIALAIANWCRPWWSTLRAGIRLLLDAATSGLFCGLLKSAIVAQVVAPNASDEKALRFAGMLNDWMSRVFPVFAAVGVAIVARDVWRILRLRASQANKAGAS